MSVDASKLKKGVKIRLETGEVLIVRGCYMSTTGIMVTAKDNPSTATDRNVPIQAVREIVEGA